MPTSNSTPVLAHWDDPRLTWDMPGLVWDGPVPAQVLNSNTTMATNKTKPIDPQMLQDDKDAVTAILAIDGYTSQKPEFDKSVMYSKTNNMETGKKVDLAKAEADLVLAENTLAAVRDRMVAMQWAQHEWVLGAREQIAAKYGKNSDEYAASGLKKKSEYKKPSTRAAKKTAGPL